MSRLDGILDRIRFARRYTLWHLDSVPEADWFRMPTEGVTHIAYQAGHIALAQYRTCLVRGRGERPTDADFIPPTYRELFGRNPPSPTRPRTRRRRRFAPRWIAFTPRCYRRCRRSSPSTWTR